MYELVLKFFGALKSLWQFMKILCTATISLLLLYWIQNLLGSEWGWMGFIAPFFKNLLAVTDSIYSLKIDFFGAVFELKYLSAVIVLIGCFYLMNLLIMLTCMLEAGYKVTHSRCKKSEEDMLNKTLKQDIIKQEKSIKKYVVTIHTTLKSKVARYDSNLNIDEQNKLMNDFIYEKLNVKHAIFEGGFMYSFDNYDKIDNVLDVLFKVMNSSAPMDYAICIQSGDELKQLKKLISLKYFGKIIMAADTCYRYKFNSTHRYRTSQIGLFQYENRTMEAHEFKTMEN